MIDGGLVMIVMGWLIAAAQPAHKIIAYRRYVRVVAIGVVLREAYPPPGDAALAETVAQADAALQKDALLSGVTDIGRVYDEA